MFEWCLTQFYLTNLNWMNRNLKFICDPFEVYIKISKSSQAWTTGLQEICMCMCFQLIKPGLWLLRMTTGRCCKKVCFTFSLVYIYFSRNLDYSAYAECWFFKQILLDFPAPVNIHVIKIITWTLTDVRYIIFSSDPIDILLCVGIGIGYKV